MGKWEYGLSNVRKEDVGGRPTESFLNDSGDDGWELVSVVPSDGKLLFFFKRPKE